MPSSFYEDSINLARFRQNGTGGGDASHTQQLQCKTLNQTVASQIQKCPHAVTKLDWTLELKGG